MKHIILLPICSFIVLLLTECNLNSVYENNKSIPDYVWDNTNIVTFEANITDTISLVVTQIITILYPLELRVKLTSVVDRTIRFSKRITKILRQ